MIVSTDFLHRIQKMLKLEYFQQDYAKKVASWVIEYYDKYAEAPSNGIESLYKVHAEDLKPAEQELIAEFLTTLSDKYEQAEHFNIDYYVNQTRDYFGERGLFLTTEKVMALLQAGKVDVAKNVFNEYKDIVEETSGWIDVLSEEFASRIYHNQLSVEIEETKDTLFSFPGALGKLMGPQKRSWLVCMLAPRKRGKSFFLAEYALHAVSHRLNVALLSLEMPEEGEGARVLQALTAMSKESTHVYPVFDCLYNQDGTCRRPERTNTFTLIVDGKIPEYAPSVPYKVCTACRNTRFFKPAYWWGSMETPLITEKKFVKSVKGFQKMFGNFMMKVYPMSGANVKQIEADLQMLKFANGFVPDIVIIDYADILAPEDGSENKMEAINETWKCMKRLAARENILVLTATQGNRQSGKSKSTESDQVSWNIAKNDHVDAQYALSQTIEEKKIGVMRVSNTLHRWQEFDPSKHVKILQNLKLSQVMLDSEFEEWE